MVQALVKKSGAGDRHFYQSMVYFRRVEEKIVEEYPKGEIRSPVHLSIGQELTSSCYQLAREPVDLAVSGHRAHLHYLASGGSLEGLFSELLAKKTGCSGGIGGSMHLTNPASGFIGSTAIVGNSIPVGLGVALAEKLNQKDSVTWIFLGDGALEEGVFYESLNLATVLGVPVIFVCENNDYSVYSKISSRQPPGRKIFELAKQIGAISFFDNGTEPDSLFEKMRLARRVALEKSNPVFIEVRSFRFLEHCGPGSDDDLGYRSLAELKFGFENDPLARLEKKLKRTLGENYINQVYRKADDTVAEAFDSAHQAPDALWERPGAFLYA